MSLPDEELQRKLDAGESTDGDTPDVRAYKAVFRALSNPIPFGDARTGFADRVLARLEQKRKRAERRDFVWFGLGLFLLIVAFVVAIAMTGFRVNLGFLKGMSSYAGLFFFGTAFIILLNWLDTKIKKSANQDELV